MRDRLSESGARDLAMTIEGYWHRKGRAVKTWIVPVRMNEQQAKTIQAYCVRSNMVNGCPQRRVH